MYGLFLFSKAGGEVLVGALFFFNHQSNKYNSYRPKLQGVRGTYMALLKT
jgi:hypothetical protein